MVVAMKSRVPKPLKEQSFLFGMMIGLIIGVFILVPLIGLKVDVPFFKFASTEVYEIQKLGHNDSQHDISMDATLANQLFNEVKVLCWIMTSPSTHESKARHVKATWGKRCNYLLFMSTKEDPSLPSVALPVIENRDNLWGKTKEAFKYVYKNYYDKADWFFKADDDTYSVMENMRYMLHYHNTSDPVYFGYRFKLLVKQGYMSGGAGYVLSKEALRRFVEESLPDPNKCKEENTGAEDAEMGKCLEAVGVEPGDSRDNEGRNTFLPLNANSFVMPNKLSQDFWIWKYNYYPLQTGLDCCSDNLISIHYVYPENMYLLEYLIYHVRPFGLSYNSTFDAVVFGVNGEVTAAKTNKENTTTNGENSADEDDE